MRNVYEKKIILITFSVIILSILLYLLANAPKIMYGRAYDEQRKKRGIPIVGERAYTVNDSAHAWMYPFKGKGHRSKHFKDKYFSILYERDTYYSGLFYWTDDKNKYQEYISIGYSYEAERAGSDPWSAVYYCKDGQHKVSLAEAEKILNSWGIKRLE